MRYYKYLYVSDAQKKKIEKIKKKMDAGKLLPGVHLITLSENGSDQLEIRSYMMLLQPSYPREDFFVVGIAKGYEEALELVEEIAREVYNETKGADIRAYILSKEQEG